MQRTFRSFASYTCAFLVLLLAMSFTSSPVLAVSEATDATENVGTLDPFLSVTPQEMEKLTGQSFGWKERITLKVFKWKMRKILKAQKRQESGPVAGCSKIILRNGDLIEATIIQITTTEVKYKRCGKPNDPEFIQALKNVLSIKDENGDTIFKGGGGPPPPDELRNDPMAIASLVTGVSGLLFGLLISGLIGILAGAVGIVLGAISIARIKRYPEKYRGKSMAWAGLITGTVIVGLFIILLALYV